MQPSTPMMAQYHQIKKSVPGAILFFRLGDFYEMFFDDAVVAARELEITLTSRNKEKGTPIPMCGVPYHSADAYVSKLIRKGYRVAVCDQVENPKTARKLVKREVTRVVTPGTLSDGNLLEPRDNNFLSAVFSDGSGLGLASVDVSTGDFRITEFRDGARESMLQTELERLGPKELIWCSRLSDRNPAWARNLSALKTVVEEWIFASDFAQRLLVDHFKVTSLDGFGCQGRDLAVAAAGGALHYLQETQRGELLHLDSLQFYELDQSMLLDQSTVRNLELLESLYDGSRNGTLLQCLDATATGMGGRLLKTWMLRPEIDLNEIESRQEAVAALTENLVLREELREQLKQVYDLERLSSKVALSSANARDLIALRQSLEQIPGIKQRLQPLAPARLRSLEQASDPLADVAARIGEALNDDPPVVLTEGRLIRPGFNPELDSLRRDSSSGKQTIAELEAGERARTGIPNLKVKFNQVFGYYLEVSKSNLGLVPPDYERKQTLVGAERFTIPRLKEYERRVLGAEERLVELEYELFCRLRAAVGRECRRIRNTARALAQLDCLVTLAGAAHQFGYVRPRLHTGEELAVKGGRHPVIERLAEQLPTGRFIPNDLYLNQGTDQILIITGPNMGGKSTYLRQAALFSVMAQMGSFVPAQEAKLPVLDRIFTRIGASDNLARGRSTFMVEMTETAVILNSATPRSLVILDEVGRGTATFDGLSIAWSAVEHLHSRNQAKTLFATHYHELTELAQLLPGVKNYQVTVKESGNEIVFLRRVEPGSADKSYGIEVARLAGLPRPVILRAREILRGHEQGEHQISNHLTRNYQRRKNNSGKQLNLFVVTEHEALEQLRRMDPDRMTPLQALQAIHRLKESLSSD
ncbi:MAG: DNA mismatch repair protein MutS [Acidobacteriota bacterium]|nr:DNA mismatch repair protein MutS [Acidobacteriota bacterium]